MMRNLKWNLRNEYFIGLFSLVICLLSATAVLAQESEQPVKMRDLPPVVQATAREQIKGAIVRGFSREVKDGQTFYEVGLKVKGHSKDVLIDSEGKVVEVEEQVALASLPQPAKAEILKQARGGRILMIESVTKNNTLTGYEAHVKTGGKISEIKVTPEGAPISN